jgi:hypothetical protein
LVVVYFLVLIESYAAVCVHRVVYCRFSKVPVNMLFLLLSSKVPNKRHFCIGQELLDCDTQMTIDNCRTDAEFKIDMTSGVEFQETNKEVTNDEYLHTIHKIFI